MHCQQQLLERAAVGGLVGLGHVVGQQDAHVVLEVVARVELARAHALLVYQGKPRRAQEMCERLVGAAGPQRRRGEDNRLLLGVEIVRERLADIELGGRERLCHAFRVAVELGGIHIRVVLALEHQVEREEHLVEVGCRLGQVGLRRVEGALELLEHGHEVA